MEFPLAMSLI